MSEHNETLEPHRHEWAVICLSCDARPNVQDHFAVFTDDRWTVEHSLDCRMNGEMVTCKYHRAIEALIADWTDPEVRGRWKITDVGSEGLPALERANPEL